VLKTTGSASALATGAYALVTDGGTALSPTSKKTGYSSETGVRFGSLSLLLIAGSFIIGSTW